MTLKVPEKIRWTVGPAWKSEACVESPLDLVQMWSWKLSFDEKVIWYPEYYPCAFSDTFHNMYFGDICFG